MHIMYLLANGSGKDYIIYEKTEMNAEITIFYAVFMIILDGLELQDT